MSNQLTKVIMENIVDKCSKVNKVSGEKVNLKNKEVDILKNIIHKGLKSNFESKVEVGSKVEKCSSHITLDELINSKIGVKKDVNKNRENMKDDSQHKRIRKINLDDIIPTVSLTSIGKKR